MINEDDIDFKAIFRLIIRNKILIIIFLTSGLFLGTLKYIFGKKVWLGEFQIVLSTKSEKGANLIDKNSDIANMVGIDLQDGSSSIKTEVEVLKSPYLLMNVFEYVKSQKGLNDDEIFFQNWRKGLNVNLIKDTSVLTLSYADSDKDLIISVLKKISQTYQDYSGKERLRNIELGIDYFQEQIDLYRKSSVQSIRAAQEFAISQDLSIIEENKEIDKEIINKINIEAIRINKANEIRSINEQLNQLEKIGEIDDYALLYVAESIPSLQEEGLPAQINQIDNKLISLKNTKKQLEIIGNDPAKVQAYGRGISQLEESDLPGQLEDIENEINFNRFVYTDEDPSIKLLVEKRKKLIEVYKKQAIAYIEADINTLTNSRPKIVESIKQRTKSFLLAQKFAAEAALKASERPKGVLIKYKELVNKAKKESELLNYLEDQYRVLTLERARYKDPWELITNPTLYRKPISPKLLNLPIGLVGGLMVGLITAFVLEKKKNLIYCSDDIRSLASKYSITKIFDLSVNSLENSFYLLTQSCIDESKVRLSFFHIDKIYTDQKKIIYSFMKKLNPKIDFKCTNKVNEIDPNSEVILVANLGLSKFNQFIEINNQISFLNKKPYGLILFSQKQIDENQI